MLYYKFGDKFFFGDLEQLKSFVNIKYLPVCRSYKNQCYLLLEVVDIYIYKPMLLLLFSLVNEISLLLAFLNTNTNRDKINSNSILLSFCVIKLKRNKSLHFGLKTKKKKRKNLRGIE